jgi:hypothetical protein
MEHGEFILALHLQRDLGLALSLPAPQDGRLGIVAEEGLVAGEGGVRALSCDLACWLRYGVRCGVLQKDEDEK